MMVEVRESAIADAGADIVVAGLFEGEAVPPALEGARGAEDARSGYRKLTLLHPEKPPRALVAGLGKREEMEPERARVVAALAAAQAAELGARSIAWELPGSGDPPATAAAIVTGTILAGYRFDRYLSSESDEEKPGEIEQLTLLGPAELSAEVEIARVCAEAQNRARELQDLPSNVATPSYLSRRAEEIDAEHGSVSAEVLGRDEIAERGMGGIEAVSAGSAEDPALIVLRYSGGGAGPPLGLVGKGVTFDTGGISLKPGTSMHEMKMDMSGAAAVLEAVAAIAELGLAIDLIAVIPSTENMPSGTAVKPGDIITQYNGKTVEVNNTDAEGRLILADALAYCVELGAGAHRRHRDAHRRRPRRPRLDLRGADLQRRGARFGGGARRRGDRRARLAAAASSRVQGADQGHGGRPDQPGGEAQGGDDLRRLLPGGVRRRPALGASRHRRHRLGRRPAVRRHRSDRLRRAPLRRPGQGDGGQLRAPAVATRKR